MMRPLHPNHRSCLAEGAALALLMINDDTGSRGNHLCLSVTCVFFAPSCRIWPHKKIFRGWTTSSSEEHLAQPTYKTLKKVWSFLLETKFQGLDGTRKSSRFPMTLGFLGEQMLKKGWSRPTDYGFVVSNVSVEVDWRWFQWHAAWMQKKPPSFISEF